MRMLKFRKPTVNDVELYYEWANDTEVRKQSFNSKKIDFESHKKWFFSKLKDERYLLLIFTNEENKNVGQVRIHEETNNNAVIGISIADGFRGQGLAKEMLRMATEYFLEVKVGYVINAYIKESNLNSKYAFENAGFEFVSMVNYEDFNSFHYIKKLK